MLFAFLLNFEYIFYINVNAKILTCNITNAEEAHFENKLYKEKSLKVHSLTTWPVVKQAQKAPLKENAPKPSFLGKRCSQGYPVSQGNSFRPFFLWLLSPMWKTLPQPLFPKGAYQQGHNERAA